MTKMNATITTNEDVVIPREFERQWLHDNDYADAPDFGGTRNYCYLPERHAAHGKIYRYQRGGYYECWQCVKAAVMSAYITCSSTDTSGGGVVELSQATEEADRQGGITWQH